MIIFVFLALLKLYRITVGLLNMFAQCCNKFLKSDICCKDCRSQLKKKIKKDVFCFI